MNSMSTICGLNQMLDKHAPDISFMVKGKSRDWLSDTYPMGCSLRQQYEGMSRKYKSQKKKHKKTKKKHKKKTKRNINNIKNKKKHKQIALYNRMANKDKGSYYTSIISSNSDDP